MLNFASLRKALTGTLTAPVTKALDYTSAFFSTRLSPTPGVYQKPYAQHAWVYACVTSIARNLSSVELVVEEGRTRKRMAERSPLGVLFDRPNPHMTETDLIFATLVFLEMEGECLWVLDRDGPNEVPRAIFPVSGKAWQIVLEREDDLFSAPKAWVYSAGGKSGQVPFKPHQVLQFKYFNPYNVLRGLSPLAAADLTLSSDSYAAHYNLEFFKNGGDPGGVLSVSGRLTEDQYAAIAERWRARHGAGRGHTMAILEGGLEYTPIASSQRDMQFLDQRKWNRDEILAVFGVPKSEVAVYEDVNFATARSQDKGYWHKVLIPKMRHLETTIQHGLAKSVPGNFSIRFDLSKVDALQEEFANKVKMARALMEIGYTQNQINDRLEMGMDNAMNDHGDQAFIPSNLIPVELSLTPPPNQPQVPGTDPTTPDTPPNPSKKLYTGVRTSLYRMRKDALAACSKQAGRDDAIAAVSFGLANHDIAKDLGPVYHDIFDSEDAGSTMQWILQLPPALARKFTEDCRGLPASATNTEVAEKLRAMMNFTHARLPEIVAAEWSRIQENLHG